MALDISLATADLTEPDCAFTAVGKDVVYTFTTTQPHSMVLTALAGSPASDVLIELRTGACDPGTQVDCSDRYNPGFHEYISSENLPAGTYYVVVGTLASGSADIGVSLELGPPLAAPTNENCTAPQVVTFSNGHYATLVDLSLATADFAGGAPCSTGASGPDVVYEVTIPAGQSLTVTALPTVDGDTVLTARSPVCTMGTAADVCGDNGYSGDPERIVVPNTTAAPATVFIILSEYYSTGGDVMVVDFQLR